jgi:hypothetical protein
MASILVVGVLGFFLDDVARWPHRRWLHVA